MSKLNLRAAAWPIRSSAHAARACGEADAAIALVLHYDASTERAGPRRTLTLVAKLNVRLLLGLVVTGSALLALLRLLG
jgi:hypothetical protein